LFAVGNKIGHYICEDCYTSILMIYLDQAKLEASDWCVGVMHWMGHKSRFSTKIQSMGKTVTPKTSYDIDSKS
jgi:hypothetical protein